MGDPCVKESRNFLKGSQDFFLLLLHDLSVKIFLFKLRSFEILIYLDKLRYLQFTLLHYDLRCKLGIP